MKKRTIKIGSYDTAEFGWTLGDWKLTAAEQKTNYVDKPGGDGSWDLSTANTNGIPKYKTRTLTVPLELSIGTRQDRENIINDMVNGLDGYQVQIVLPDRPDHYLFGRVKIAVDYSDLAHAKVTLTGTVEPWFYSIRETAIEATATPEHQTMLIRNNGRRVAVPLVAVTEGEVTLRANSSTAHIGPGTHKLPGLLLRPGTTELEYYGAGSFVMTYREAVLR